MRVLYFDCFSGAAGDMILGALLDGGAPEEDIRAVLDALDIGGFGLRLEETRRAGVRALHAVVETNDSGIERRFRDVADLVTRAPLVAAVKERALSCFSVLAQAEGRVHGVDPDDVRLHEVGALDALIDVVGACAALEHFLPARVLTSPIATGTGTVESAHGPLPLPAPAVVEILRGRGATLYGRGDHELVTPTGAALLATFSDSFGSLPPMTVDAVGHGAGSRDGDVPNIVRLLIGEMVGVVSHRSDAFVIETNLDDLTPEIVAHVVETLLDAGAQDAWVTPTVMKKGRPAFTLSVLADPERRADLIDIIYRETGTLGMRVTPVDKLALDRKWLSVDVEGHPVRVKLGLKDGEITSMAPEHEDAARVARITGLPLKEVYARALEGARIAPRT
jgi:uncharacterized protein (TIGR00299 family) protein